MPTLITNSVQIERFANALYGVAVGSATMSAVNADISSNGGLTNTLNNYYSNSFGSLPTSTVASTIVSNLGIVAGNAGLAATDVANAVAYVKGVLDAATPAARGAAVVSILNTWGSYTTDKTYGGAATTWNGLVDNAIAYSLANSADVTATVAASTVTAAATAAAAAAASAAAAAAAAKLTLTTGTDAIVGTTGNDTFTATAATWNVGDTISGNGGADTLNATLNGAGPQQSATTLTGVQTINLTATPNPSSIDLTGVTGVTSINNVSSANGATLAVTGVGNVVNTSITGGNTSTTITYTTAAVAGTADTETLTLNGVNAGSSYSTSGVEVINLVSATATNNLSSGITDTALTTLNISGSQNLTIGGTTGGTALATVNASTSTGSLTMTLGAGAGGTSATGVRFTGGSGATTLTTGANNDTVTEGNGNNTVNTQGGNDTIVTGTGTNTTTPGTGNDTLTLNGADTVRYAEFGPTNADVINGFSIASGDVIALNLGGAQLASTATTAAQAASSGAFGLVQTNATTPTLPNVNGIGTGTTITFQSVTPNATASSGTVAGTSNVLNLTGALTDGTAQGIINAFGTTLNGAGITTTPNGKFTLVAYTAGNVAQIWEYQGDGVGGTANGSTAAVDGAVQSAELALVATVNGVAPNSLTAAAFTTYLTTPTASATVSNSGQTLNLTGTLNNVNSTTNANGQFLTGANDTINVGVGTLPVGTTSATVGFTIIDPSSTDADVMNATVLGDWANNSTVSGVETINLNMLVAGTTFSASARTPGTTTFGLTGTQPFLVTALPASPTIALNTGYTGAVTGSMNVTGAFNVTLNGAGTFTAATATAASAVSGAPSLAMVTANAVPAIVGGVGTTSTVTVTGTNYLQAQVASNAANLITTASLFGVPTVSSAIPTTTFTGSGNLTVVGVGAAFDAQSATTNSGWTGTLTLRPTDNGNFDLTGITATTGAWTGINAIDLSSTPAPGTIVLAAANGNFPVTVSSTSPTSLGALNIGFASTSPTTQTNQLVITESNASANIGAVQTPFVNTLTINLGGTAGTTATKTLGAVTMDVTAAAQNLTITSNATATTTGALTADSVTTTGVVGTFTGSFATGGTGSVFSGNATQASYFAGTTSGNDIITTGSANDSITLGTGNSNVNGGLGNDTYIFNGTTSGSTVVTDAGGTDTFYFSNTLGGNASTINSGATFASMGIERLMVTGGQAITVASSQVGAQNINAVGATATVGLTLLTAGGTLNASTLTFTQGNAISATGGTVTGVVPTSLVLTGSANADTITASTTVATTITPGAGADTIALGTHTVADRVIQAAAGDSGTFALQAANSISTTTFDVITGLNTGDTLALAAYTGIAAGAAQNSVLVNALVTQLTSVINTGTTAGANQVNSIRGTYSSSANTFVGATGGSDLLLVYDANATQLTTALEAVVLVGLGANTIGVVAGTGGILSIS